MYYIYGLCGKTNKLGEAVASLKPGQSFTVETEKERQSVCRMVKILRDAGCLTHQIITKKEDDHFKVAAI